jgi:hypothetical protein
MLALAPPPPALPAVKVDSAWVASPRATRVASLSLRGVPSRARVSLTRTLRRVGLRVGARLDVRVSDPTGTLLVYVGTPYTYGGATPQTGFDASGLVQYAYGQAGVGLPRVADDQCRAAAPVAPADLLPGHVVCFADTTGYVDHVGYNALAEPYYSQRLSGARRFG